MGTLERSTFRGIFIFFNFDLFQILKDIPFTKMIIWCDGGAHFDSHLFALYLASFQKNYRIRFFLNYHIAGEGKCDLDRFFGFLVCAEKLYIFHGMDIIGVFFKIF
jgi:hypothetical protein